MDLEAIYLNSCKRFINYQRFNGFIELPELLIVTNLTLHNYYHFITL
jgi:hypothetical protein